MVQSFYAKKLREGTTASRVKNIHATLHTALEHARRIKLVSMNVCADVQVPQREKPKQRPLTPKQAQLLLQKVREHQLEGLLTLAIITGMREGELLGLRWSDVDLETGLLRIVRTLTYVTGYGCVEGEPKTAKGKRNIMLPQFAIDVLKRHRTGQFEKRLEVGTAWIDRDLVFPDNDGDFLISSIGPFRGVCLHLFFEVAVLMLLPTVENESPCRIVIVGVPAVFQIPFRTNHCLSVDVCRSELVMARRFLPPDVLRGYGLLSKLLPFRPLTWKVIGVMFALLLIIVPTYITAERAGSKLVPELTSLFYAVSDPNGSFTPKSLPAFPSALPLVGTIPYTVQEGESCDSILVNQMRFMNANEVFSDQNPETVQSLGANLGRDCHKLDQDMVVALSPQYPLIAFGGEVLRVGSLTSPQGIPTPLISLPHAERYVADCTQGCLLSVKIAPRVQVYLTVSTKADIFPGSWIWSQAALARKVVPNFADYPYADPAASLNGMALQACNFQVNGAPLQTQTSPSCDELTTKNITMDGGAWLFAVTGPSALGHWNYPLKNVPSGSRVLIWLSDDDSGLTFHPGDPAYRYDKASHGYVKL